jgi:S1-C subfamily serine protease
MNLLMFKQRKLLCGALMLGLTQLSVAAESSRSESEARTPEAVRAEMQQLSQRMGVLAQQLRQQGASTGNMVMRVTPEGGVEQIQHHDLPMPVALGLVLRAKANGGIDVQAVTPGSGAEKAGIKAGDELTAVRGKALAVGATVADARNVIGALKAGESVAVTVKRGEQTLALNVTANSQPRVMMLSTDAGHGLGNLDALALDDEHKAELDVLIRDAMTQNGVGGARQRIKVIRTSDALNSDLDLVKLNPELASYFGTPRGVLSLDVKGYAPSLPGDVILAVNGQQTDTPAQVFEQFRTRRGSAAEVSLVRQKAPITVSVAVPLASLPPIPPTPPAPTAPPAPPGA